METKKIMERKKERKKERHFEWKDLKISENKWKERKKERKNSMEPRYESFILNKQKKHF